MSNTVALRSGKDRLRYSIALEIGIMTFLIPAGVVFFDRGFADIGLLGLILSIKAVLVGLIYNRVFDHFDARRGCVASNRTPAGRVFHAVGFEVSLLITSLPIYTLWIGLTILEAVATDLVVTSFVVVFTYVFTIAYDCAFPVPTHRSVAR